MTNRWRLVNQNQLYDMDTDPGQKQNVAEQFPRVVERLQDVYEAWWQELKPTFSQDCPIFLGDPAENPVRLTCHDWLAPHMTPWNQLAIRRGASAPRATGPWKVKVVSAGQYEISLRRWPREADAAIDAPLPPAPDVPGERAWRTHPGTAIPITRAAIEIDGKTMEKKVTPGSKAVLFKVRLNKGTFDLKATFHTSDNQQLGAYYAYVKRLDL